MKTNLFLLCALCVIGPVACAAPAPMATLVPLTTTVIPLTLTPVPSTATAISPTPNLHLTPTPSAPTAESIARRALPEATIRVGDLDRTYLNYVPANLPRNAPLLFALHPRNGVAETMRSATVYEFENLADQNGFVVVYPNGYQHGWNDCRKAAYFAAKTQNIDDIGFIRALIAKFRSDYDINTSRVFAVGYSNGGDMAYRLAAEMPDEITAVAAIGANLPAENNNNCRISGKPIPVLIMNGTDDSLNPYNGGGGFDASLSTQASAEYFAKLNGQTSPPKTARMPHQDVSDPTSVDRTLWNDADKSEVVLVTVNGGGHTIPQPKLVFGPQFGRTNKDLNGLVEIWEFFARQRSLK